MEFPEDIYSTRILEVVASTPEIELLPESEGPRERGGVIRGSGIGYSKLCGSKIQVNIDVREGKIVDYGHEVKACLLGQTAAAVMARNAIGSTRGDVVAIRDKMLAMLKDDGMPPDGIWADLEVLYPVKDYKPRHTSMMLVFGALIDAFDDAAKKAASGSTASD